jgi:hypothetical protein
MVLNTNCERYNRSLAAEMLYARDFCSDLLGSSLLMSYGIQQSHILANIIVPDLNYFKNKNVVGGKTVDERRDERLKDDLLMEHSIEIQTGTV